ncbi:MAG: PBP1A family penicillin-binding protein [Calditrichaeota bacterium]|nr:MAG: PBP1A family penicillin-binding protein [Calditrichota bacterium]
MTVQNPQTPPSSGWHAIGRFVRNHPWISAIGFGLVVGIFYFLYLVQGMPSLQELENINPALVTRIYSQDGQLIHELFTYKRVYVPYEKIPDHTVQALLATEDREFFNHWGINIKRIPKAILVDLLTLSFRQGFSTITMQLARNLYTKKIGFQKNINRKLREILTAIQIERTYSKKEILEMYLNMAYFGHGVYGVESAARRYFGKHASDLSPEESATLVALLKSPAYYSPITHPDRAMQRRNLVLHNMLVCGYLTQTQFDSLKNLPVKAHPLEEYSKIAPYFTEYVRQKLNGMQDSLGVNIYEDGLNVYTTLNTTIQACMDSAVHEFLPRLQEQVSKNLQRWKEKENIPDSVFAKKAKVQLAFIALDHHNGHILAMIGGRDFAESKFNRAVQARRQPGSAFKPFLYTAAIDNGYPPTFKLLNQPVVVHNPDGTRWDPENFTKTFGGLTTLREGLRKSINLIAVRLILEIGPGAAVEYARRMGISTPLRPFPSLAVGSSEVIPLELVSAYSVFANQGVRVEPIAITRVEDRYGNVLYEAHPRQQEVLSRATAYIMTNMLEDVVNKGTGGSLRWRFNFYAPAAGKTGTTNDYTDAWFVGFTPHLTAGVWVGLDDPELKLGPGQTGAHAALPFWALFMKCVYDTLHLSPEPFRQPPDVVRLEVCEDSGKLATQFCPRVVEEVFNVKYRPTESCDLHPGPHRRKKKKKIFF